MICVVPERFLYEHLKPAFWTHNKFGEFTRTQIQKVILTQKFHFKDFWYTKKISDLAGQVQIIGIKG